MIAGRSTLAAPISCAGMVLSQLATSTTASNGYARSVSSTSIDIRFRNIIAVGFISVSPSEIAGNSTGRPPADSTPRLTASVIARKWRLQLTSSEKELQMPTTGRSAFQPPAKPPVRSTARCTRPEMSAGPNQRALRSSLMSPALCRELGRETAVAPGLRGGELLVGAVEPPLDVARPGGVREDGEEVARDVRPRVHAAERNRPERARVAQAARHAGAHDAVDRARGRDTVLHKPQHLAEQGELEAVPHEAGHVALDQQRLLAE